MLSRARMIIELDYEKLKNNKPWGIEAWPIRDDNYFEWTAQILGIKGTCWEGGAFRVYIKFDEYYNSQPPKVCFHTIPFHPNIDAITGKPSLDVLDDWSLWCQGTRDISAVLVAVQELLCNPTAKNIANYEAHDFFVNKPEAYRQIVRQCVIASQMMKDETQNIKSSATHGRKVHPEALLSRQHISLPTTSTAPKKIAFEDYHAIWCGIATSKPKDDSTRPSSELKRDHHLPQANDGNVSTQKHTKTKADEERKRKIDQMNKMRKIYLQQTTPLPTTARSVGGEFNTQVVEGNTNTSQHVSTGFTSDEGGTVTGTDRWELDDTDELVSWTHSLDVNAL